MNRRHFLKTLGVGLLSLPPFQLARSLDWEQETPAAAAIHEYLLSVFGGLRMALDFRCINARYDEEFRIQINAFELYPVASCFKAWLILYYLRHTPPENRDTSDSSPLYQVAVNSNNTDTGVVLAEVAERVPGPGNAIEKFNNFLLETVGLANGLHTWNWPNTPTVGLSDARFAPSDQRRVNLSGASYEIDNVFTAADLARGYDFLLRGEYFTSSLDLKAALQTTRALLSIRAPSYRSPIERAYSQSYVGKDGILPASDTPAGRVVNDAGIILLNERYYLIAFMSAGESESTALYVLGEVIKQMQAYATNG
ncbi:MAG TPA: hypothetical protein VHO69_17665 [Phototrophicaceae bacterium]|nr:hypothetical protein [Phototrophicaceae bacterium]